jgi:hypothetical protein
MKIGSMIVHQMMSELLGRRYMTVLFVLAPVNQAIPMALLKCVSEP